jgi:hypothetical protein
MGGGAIAAISRIGECGVGRVLELPITHGGRGVCTAVLPRSCTLTACRSPMAPSPHSAQPEAPVSEVRRRDDGPAGRWAVQGACRV